MKTKFFTIAAAIVLALGFSATESKAQSAGGSVLQPPTSTFLVKAYPNPTADIINIELNMPKVLFETVKIEIVDVTGQVLYLYGCMDCIDKSVHTVNVKNWAAGLYYVRVTYKNQVKITKFIKIDG